MDSLEQLKKRLYKSEEILKAKERKEPVIKREKNAVPSEWEKVSFQKPEDVLAASKEVEKYLQKRKRKRTIFLFGGLVGALLILIIFLGYKFYIQGGGLGFLSAENIEIRIEGPAAVKAGEKVSWSASVKNNNKISLEDANLIIEYPEGSELDGQFASSLIETKPLGGIGAGAEIKESFEAFVFGEENGKQKIKVSLEYRLKDSSAIFEKSEEKTFTISQPAATIFIEAPKEVSAGKKANFKVEVISNTAAVLRNLVLDLEYPEGFKFENAAPVPSQDNSRWRIGDLSAGEKKIINIQGLISAQEFVKEESILALVGVLDEKEELRIYSKKTASLEIKKPFLDIVLKVNGKEKYAAQTGERLNVELKWANNLAIGIKNAIIEAKIQGEATDLTSLDVQNGTYRSFDKTIVWDASTFPKFVYLESGEEGTVSFSIPVKKKLDINGEKDKNFTIEFEARFFTSFIPENYGDVEISGQDKKTVQIISNFQFVQRGLFYSGPFKNSGPIPPRLAKETTYTIIWSLINSSNDLSGVMISSVLPNYVQWQNQIFPAEKSGELFFDPDNREIIWSPGNIKAGTGLFRPAEEISFQILFLPGEPHLNSSPILISKTEAGAKDDFASVTLADSEPAVTTELRDDPAAGSGGGKVIQ